MRSSKDLAKRLRFDRFPRPNFFRRWYLAAGAVAAIVGLVAWLAFSGTFGRRQYLPGPVSQNHATFGDRCEKCHTASFASVPNDACLACHPARVHSEFERDTPRCGTCHVEHRHADVFLAVSNRSCVACHADLVSTRPQPILETKVPTFAAHPPFTPLREGRVDTAAIRFNHKIHLTSDKVNEKLRCRSCHRPDRDGALMRPIVFERHCRRCHEQKPEGPLGAVEALHETPEVIRPDLGAKLLAVAVDNPEAIFEGVDTMLPGRINRPPIDTSRTLGEYRQKWLAKVEAALYAPLEDTPPLLEKNKYCFLCHFEDGTHAPGELPKIKDTGIPHRWLKRAAFSHRPHEMLPCDTCHASADKSVLTTDTNLPRRDVCLRCHIDGAHQSAGTGCMLCHLYHDTSKDPALRAIKTKELSIEKLKGE